MSGDPIAYAGDKLGRLNLAIGEKVIVAGRVSYFQDFSGWSDDFGDGVEFTVSHKYEGHRYGLTAPGYGDLSKGGNYGNGFILVAEKFIRRAMEAHP